MSNNELPGEQLHRLKNELAEKILCLCQEFEQFTHTIVYDIDVNRRSFSVNNHTIQQLSDIEIDIRIP